jgi:beta-xylosidase
VSLASAPQPTFPRDTQCSPPKHIQSRPLTLFLSVYELFRLKLDWHILNPDPSYYSLTKKPGTLTITTQDGGFGILTPNYENLFLIGCPAAPGEDFQLTTCIRSFRPEANYNQAGLVCYNDDNNYVRFYYEWNSFLEGCLFTVGMETEGQPVYIHFRAPLEIARVWLRITKQGNRYAFFTSLDGETFVPMTLPIQDHTGLFQRFAVWGDGSLGMVGLSATNGTGTGAPEIDAAFDFFEVKTLSSGPARAKEAVCPGDEEMKVETGRQNSGPGVE